MRILVLVVCLLAAAASSPALTLKEAVETAARQNPDLLLARYRAAELKAQADLVRTGYLPQLAARAAASYQTTNLQGIGINFPGVPSRIPAYRVFDARPVLTQQVLDLSLLAQIRAARERERAAVEEIAALKERTLFAVAQLYLQALQADSRAQAVEARLKTASSVLDQVKDKESAGSASKLDIARATQEAERERTLLAGARREAAVLRTLLAQAIGLEDSKADSLEAVDLTAASLITEEEAWKQARAARAEFRALDAQTRAAAQAKKAADRQQPGECGIHLQRRRHGHRADLDERKDRRAVPGGAGKAPAGGSRTPQDRDRRPAGSAPGSDRTRRRGTDQDGRRGVGPRGEGNAGTGATAL